MLAITASGLGIIAGCVSGGRSGADAPDQPCTIETPSNSDLPVSTNTESFLETYPSEKPRVEIVIGDEQAQSVEIPDTRIENETSASHSITATVSKGTESPTEVMRANCEIASGAYVSIAPTEATTYHVRVQSDAIEGHATQTIEEWMFEQDRSVTCHINIRSDAIESACGGGGGGAG